MDIKIIEQPVAIAVVRQAAAGSFGDMVKAVVDVGRGVLALGGSLHADAEAVLLEHDSHQEDLWGVNLYPDRSPAEWIEYTSLINVRPRAGNRSVVIADEGLRATIRTVVERLVMRV